MSKPLVLCILDGYGLGKKYAGNAIALSNSPTMEMLKNKYPWKGTEASGTAVGLPANQFGNSEVGHLSIGAGRTVFTGLSLINESIKNKDYGKIVAFKDAFNHVNKNKSTLHIMGLLSPGGVHSHEEHIFELLRIASKNVDHVVFHAFGDGRDVAPRSIKTSLLKLQTLINKSKNIELGVIAGRFYAMDRDKRWERINKAYEALTLNTAPTFNGWENYIDAQYKANISDEFIIPARNIEAKHSLIKDNDAIIFANFRPDRARELSHYLINSKYYDNNPEHRAKNLWLTIMMNYEGIKANAIAFPPTKINNCLGKVLEDNNVKQLRIAETEKYAHVTFFFDGGEELKFKNEKKVLIPSPKVETYDLKPEMSAIGITDALLQELPNHEVVILNYANADMVGHTGNLKATIKACEVIDTQIKRLYEKVKELDGTLIITADHGNAEIMLDENGEVVTKHSSSLVPLLITNNNIQFKNDTPKLSDIAPTILDILGIDQPVEMTGHSVIKK